MFLTGRRQQSLLLLFRAFFWRSFQCHLLTLGYIWQALKKLDGIHVSFPTTPGFSGFHVGFNWAVLSYCSLWAGLLSIWAGNHPTMGRHQCLQMATGVVAHAPIGSSLVRALWSDIQTSTSSDFSFLFFFVWWECTSSDFGTESCGISGIFERFEADRPTDCLKGQFRCPF